MDRQPSGTKLDLQRELDERGYFVIRRGGPRVLVDVLEELGRVIHVEDVVVTPESASLVKSERGLSLHTDHHRADVIVWHCLAQSDQGGETIISDALAALTTLSREEQSALTHVHLKEHSVFIGDEDRYPLLSVRRGRPRIYYSYWMVEEGLRDEERAAFEAFTRAVERGHRVTLRLEPGDILGIDNGQMLHGRQPITGSKERHLRRYWLELGA